MNRIKSIYKKAPMGSIVILSWLVIAIIGPFLVHEVNDGGFPPLVPYNPSTIDLSNAGAIGPFGSQQIESSYHRHWLGTDEIGRDVVAQLVYGSRTAIIVGFFSVFISAIIGIFIGVIPAYLGDKSIRASRIPFYISLLFSLFVFLYFLFVFPWSFSSKFSSFILLVLSIGLLILSWRWAITSASRSKKKTVNLAFDMISGRLIEAMDSLPILFIIISLSAILKPSIYMIVLIIGISNWAGIARYARSETLKVKGLSYIESARAIGMKNLRIISNHILPNALGPVVITLSFGIAAAILIEATLSFLGIGIGIEEASWGSMMAEARKSPDAWWLAIFPGLAIFLVVYSCNKLGEKLLQK